MQIKWIQNLLWAPLPTLLVLTGCMDTPTGEAEDTPQQPTITVATDSEQAEPTTAEATTTVPTAADEIVIRPEANPGDDENNSWIGTALMTDDGIELVWDVAGQPTAADEEISYQIYRLPTDLLAKQGWASPEEAVLAGDQLLHEIPTGSTTFVDQTVETGNFYTYYLVGLTSLTDGADRADGDNFSVKVRRWTTGLAVTDTEPPTAIVGLEAEVTDDGVLLNWQPSTDNVEFASYSVSVVAANGQATYLGGGADPSLVSFLDNRPGDLDADGTVESGPAIDYLVEAVDFHNNRSEPATITVTLP